MFLIKGGDVLEAAHQVGTVVFDKTGTLTQGRPVVVDVIGLGSTMPIKEMLYYVAAAEMSSEHALGAAIVAMATCNVPLATGQENVDLSKAVRTSFVAQPGRGLQ